MSEEEELRKAGKAALILDNELFKEAVAEIEEALKQARLNSGATDVALREKLCAQEVALHSILGKLRTHIETGKMAEESIRRKSLVETAKEFFN